MVPSSSRFSYPKNLFCFKSVKSFFPFALKAFLLLSILSFTACTSSTLEKKNLRIRTSEGKEFTVKAEIARTSSEREKGFMFRKHIPEGTGMLFIFENDQILRFWMKNTPTPLSIAFITSDGKIRDIFDMTPYSLADTVSTGYVRYALEVPQNWFSKNGIKTGDFLELGF